MLYAVFEYLELDMEDYGTMHIHKIKKDVDAANRFQLGIHVDDVETTDVLPDPKKHVQLKSPVKILARDMRRDPDDGLPGFVLMKGSQDIDSVMEVLPERPCIHEVWAWYDVERAMAGFLKDNNIKLTTLDSFTKRYLGFKISEHELHIGCIYVVKYGAIRNVKIEAVPTMPAVRIEVYRRMHKKSGDLRVVVKECMLDKQSEPDVFDAVIPTDKSFAVVQLAKSPLKIDIDIYDANGAMVYMLRKVTFLAGPVNNGSKKALKAMGKPQKSVIGLEEYYDLQS